MKATWVSALVILCAVCPVLAASRTTPTTVENAPTVKIDATTNTVKATQNGTWSVNLSTVPTLNVNTHPVTQSGAWNFGILGTANTVKAPAQLTCSPKSVPPDV